MLADWNIHEISHTHTYIHTYIHTHAHKKADNTDFLQQTKPVFFTNASKHCVSSFFPAYLSLHLLLNILQPNLNTLFLSYFFLFLGYFFLCPLPELLRCCLPAAPCPFINGRPCGRSTDEGDRRRVLSASTRQTSSCGNYLQPSILKWAFPISSTPLVGESEPISRLVLLIVV